MAKQIPPPGNRQIKTLERVFSKAGAGSRTDARSWIGAGRVRVNGKVVQNPDHWVDLESDRVTLDGKPLRSATKTYVLLYKPKGRHPTAGRLRPADPRSVRRPHRGRELDLHGRGVPQLGRPGTRRYLRVEERARRRPSARRPTPGRVRGCPLPPARTPDTRRTHLRCRAPWPSSPVGGNPAIRQPRGGSARDDPQHGRSRTVRSPGGDGRRESRGEGHRRRDHRRP